MRVFQVAEQEGYTLRGLARAVGMSHSTLIDYREGRRPPSGRFIAAVRRLPGWERYSLEYLFPQPDGREAIPA